MSYLLRPCRSDSAYLALPDSRLDLDLGAVDRLLQEHGYEVLNVKVMLIATGEEEITVYRSGKLLIKTRDPEVAAREADRFWALDPASV